MGDARKEAPFQLFSGAAGLHLLPFYNGRMTTFLLVRHAETNYAGRALAGRLPQVGLTEQGRQQAHQLAERLRLLPLAAIYCTSLERTQQTAEPVAAMQSLSVTVDDSFLEIDFAAWSGLTWEQLGQQEAWRVFNQFRSTVGIPGGETMLAVQSRAIAGLERLRRIHANQYVAIVSHADVIRAALVHFLGMPLDFLLRLEISPASVSILRVADWGPQVTKINDTGLLTPSDIGSIGPASS